MKFSITTQTFYADGLSFGDSLPIDTVDIEQSAADEFFQAINNGSRIFDDSGKLTASEPKPDSYYSWDDENNCWMMTDEAIGQKKQDAEFLAEQQKTMLRQRADSEISWRQDAVDAAIATDEETAALAEWKKYRVLLMRVDTAKPVWPTPPVEQAS